MLQELRVEGYKVSLFEGNLKIKGPKLTDELRARIKENKQSIIEELRREAWEQIVRLWESERGLSVDDTAAAVIEVCNDEYETCPLTWMIRLSKDRKIERDQAAIARAMRIAGIEPTSDEYDFCDHCGEPFKDVCPRCDEDECVVCGTELEWGVCPFCNDDEKEIEEMDREELLERAREHDAEAVRELEMRDGVEEEAYA